MSDEFETALRQAAGPTQAQWAWRIGGDTGISSETIWHVMTGIPVPPRCWLGSTPMDPDDFGRCHRLLLRFPGWRSRMSDVAAAYPAWAPLVARWGDMAAIYERDLSTGRSDELYDLMQNLRAPPSQRLPQEETP